MYVRPALCRLCKCPAMDTGVPMTELDLEKFSKWWTQLLGVNFEDVGQEEHERVCQFCLCDAMLEAGLKERSDCNWWSEHAANKFYRNFYFRNELIRPCEVKIFILPEKKKEKPSVEVTSPTLHEKPLRRDFTPRSPFNCIYCNENFKNKMERFKHVLSTHKKIPTFKCFHCLLFFKNATDSKFHKITVHRGNFLCYYCSSSFQTSLIRSAHIMMRHQKSKLQCKHCSATFQSSYERQTHVMSMHKDIKLVQCIYCLKLVCQLGVHVHTKHRSSAIRCIDMQCKTYFLTDNEKLEHISELHNLPGLTRCMQCYKMVPLSHLAEHKALTHGPK